MLLLHLSTRSINGKNPRRDVPRHPVNSCYSWQNRLRIEQCFIRDGFCRQLADTVFR